MCGIAGYILNQPAPSAGLLRAMSTDLVHRGPDDEGFVLINRARGLSADFSSASSPEAIRRSLPSVEQADSWAVLNGADLFLAHRRFAIISPTPEGHQPFRDSNADLVLIFNGEIYNYLELRTELQAAGSVFRTATDTEVLAEAYRAWGEGCFERLNGMWALAIYDFRQRLFLLSRDRTGERPLYWTRNPKGMFFASEIKALINHDSVCPRRRINDSAVQNFLHRALADIDTTTFFQDIDRIPPATVVKMDCDGAITENRFWRFRRPEPRNREHRSIADVSQEFRDLFRDSVRLRLRADVPVNVALSGGLDSSSIVAMGATLRDGGLDTYTVRFQETEWNEWPYAAAVAEMYGVRNLVAEPEPNWTWEYLARFVVSMEEPFHAPDLVFDHVVRRILASHGIKVSLSGLGGDELFGGYEYYRGFYAGDLKREGQWIRGLSELLLASEQSPAGAAKRLLLGKLRRPASQPLGDDIAAQAIAAPLGELNRDLPQSMAARLEADVEWALLPYWLRAGDKSSMAIPIEVRYPFLDHRLIEFAAALPLSFLVHHGWLKWILRKSMQDMLPKSVTWRRKKMGFPAPIVELLTSSLPRLHAIFDNVDDRYLSPHFWKRRLEDAVKQSPWLVWRALSLELWRRYFIEGLPVLPVAFGSEAEIKAPAAEFYATA